MTKNPDTVSEKNISSTETFTRSQKMIILIGVMLEVFIGSSSQLIIVTAMPRIITDLGGFGKYTWVAAIYMIGTAVSMPIAGKLSDIYGRKWLYVSGITIFLAFSTLCGFSTSINQLIIFRLFQGIGFGTMMTLGMVIMADIFPPSERGKYTGFITGVFGISSLIGPPLGGYLTDYLSWRYCFFFNIPFGIVIIVLFALFFPQIRTEKERQPIDIRGITALTIFIVGIMLSLNWGGRRFDWLSLPIVGMFSLTLLAFFLFIKFEQVAKDPVLPLNLLKNDIVAVSTASVFLQGLCFFACVIFIPLFLQGVMGMSAMESGNLLTAMVMGMVVASILSGQLLSRAGGHYRIQALVSFIFTGTGLFLLSKMNAGTSPSTAVFNMILLGLGNGILMPLYMITVQNAVPYSMLGSATATMNVIRTLGGIFGMAVYGSMMNKIFFAELFQKLTPDIKAVLSNEKWLEIAKNPQALVNPNGRLALMEQLSAVGAQGEAMFNRLLSIMQNSLGSALVKIFFVSFILILFAFVLNLFLREIPLRTSIRDDPS
jgi:EmrB/QacA subfamily drug resistance transporter